MNRRRILTVAATILLFGMACAFFAIAVIRGYCLISLTNSSAVSLQLEVSIDDQLISSVVLMPGQTDYRVFVPQKESEFSIKCASKTRNAVRQIGYIDVGMATIYRIEMAECSIKSYSAF